MIIEIKEIPNGSNIKKISFDIELENGEIKRSNDYVIETTRQYKEQEIPRSDVHVFRTEATKEVPPEMLDMEF